MNIKLMLITLIATTLLSNLALGVPGIPHAFYGSVTWNGSPAPDGTVVSAKIDGVEVASTTTKNGKYGYDPVFYINDPNNNRQGEIIRFFINNVDTGQTAIFNNGAVTQLDLSAGGTGGGGGGAGGGAGGTGGGTAGSATNQTPTQQQGCQERWVCSEWGPCLNGIQTRSCVDQNNCGTNNKEPFTSQPCSAEERKEEKSSQGVSGITGFFALLSNPIYALGFILGIIAIVILVLTFFLSRRKK